jgi:transglutaminase-like putative cysteine protease
MRAVPTNGAQAMEAYLAPSQYIDFKHPLVAEKAQELADGATTPLALVDRCFKFVRDEIQHSWDFRRNPVTCKASDVLQHGTGYCYAKSHLLAALLRPNGIPTGFCYQRLSVEDAGPPYSLHGLNAVFLPQIGWYRIDARGNKPGVEAEFCPPVEKLAFPIQDSEERDLPEIWAEPHPAVTAALERYTDVADVHFNLPDIKLIASAVLANS